MNTTEQVKNERASTYDLLISRHGPLMKIDEVAGVFHKSTAAIRIILSRESSLSTALNQAKNRFGRRLYFRTEQIADLVDNGVEGSDAGQES